MAANMMINCQKHNRQSSSSSVARSCDLAAIYLLLLILNIFQAQAIPQQQQQQEATQKLEQNLQPKANNYHQQSQVSANLNNSPPDQTADLSLLINETLAINNKTVSSSDKPIVIKDDWTFDMIEYDLMEFLQNLSARYKQNGTGAPELDGAADGQPLVGLSQQQQESQLEGKQSPTKADGSPTDCAEIGKTSLVSGDDYDDRQSMKPAINKPPGQQQQQLPLTPKIQHPTSIPQLSTSLASLGDQEIGESSWQYGIFDRFTRPRSSTRAPATPADSQYDSVGSETGGDGSFSSSHSNSRLDVRYFNSDECGLRTYEEQQAQYYPQEQQMDLLPVAIGDSPATIKRQKLPTNPADRKKYQMPSSVLDLVNDRGDLFGGGGASENVDDLTNKRDHPMLNPWKDGDDDEETGAPAAAADGQTGSGDGASPMAPLAPLTPPLLLPPPGSGDSMSESDFNLASRRHWLQQQLGNTLQLLGVNITDQPVSAMFLNQTAGSGLNLRENMMKKSGKLGKSIGDHQSLDGGLHNPPVTPDTVGTPVGVGQQQQQPQHEQKLLARQDDLKLEARVIGGSDARLGDSPWSVSLQALVARPGTGGVEYRHYCGGTIISEYYVLTAAHCLDFMVGRESRLFVVVGDLNWRMSTSSMHGRRFGIEKLIIHSGYKSTAFGHDIGLIRTKESMRPLKVNGKYIINSVCLPQKGVEHSGEAELVGWGLFSNRNEMADSLQIADVPILPRPLCVDLYRRRTGLIQWLIGIELITDKQVCAGTFGRGICQGDSGSALVINEKYPRQRKRLNSSKGLRASSDRETKRTRATIIGIVAFGGIRRCSYQSLPGVYMQTSKYMDWIMPRIQA